MLIDVIKDREQIRIREIEEERNKWSTPVKRETIIYYEDLHIIGGIETWIYTLAKNYEFSLVYKTADKKQLERLEKLNIECIKDLGQPIECNTMIFTLIGREPNVKAKRRILFIHGDYRSMEEIDYLPECNEIYGVSEYVSKQFEKITGKTCKTMYNPLIIEEHTEPLIFSVFSRLSAEKGKERIIYLLDKLVESDKPFLMIIFTDLQFEYNDKRVIFLKPTLENMGWIKKSDYVVQLSDREAGCYTMQEALKIGTPVIITELPILKEFNITEKEAKIIRFDMTNLDINDLWNKPKVKWSEPISKGWEEIMKKKVYREKKQETKPEEIIKEEIIEKPKKTAKKVK